MDEPAGSGGAGSGLPGPARQGSGSAESSSETGRGIALAYRYLNRRERTAAEVRARLEQADVPEQEIDAVLAELLEFGYVDDARYARVFTQDKRTLEAWGNERIARTLRERGVERELIEAALTGGDAGAPAGRSEGGAESWEGGAAGGWGDGVSELGHATSELDRAIALLGQRFPAGPGEPRDRERAFGVLARKGYESETASDAVREWARRAAA